MIFIGHTLESQSQISSFHKEGVVHFFTLMQTALQFLASHCLFMGIESGLYLHSHLHVS